MLFKKLVLAACAFGSLTSAHAGGGAKPFLIISDIDDTIKITNVLDKDKAVENGLFGDRTFLGMAELYQELASNGGMKAAPVVYMSGSPPILLGEIRKMLVGGHKFPDGNFRLRDWLKTKDVYSFKSAGMLALHAIFAKSKTVFVELGDDTERDMDVYHDYIKAHPGKTAAA
ncbi:MAG: DUF2183 domain-containing protein, partial [Deltaproteobacteria bacterium]|nr:DUF2183 domain-containing protein [Deltaproteobacteria bacterium]